ncbi:MarR family winged helix-turn-helix transcriptional regulator [Proteocatella sphenisci]|uniref:MarR family winged helix-turn-helix transcriptional regulator n=1 Tax=Proteocatella sphenisci TaxID=181070 RepID=UPI00048C35F5|nr:MarR family transcriptional regulator [Proteocatella sphenisci]
MSKIESLKDQKFIFGSVQIVANKMNTLLERELKEYDITSKQWFLTVVIENSFDKPPTIKEAAKVMGSSHQNVKQVALKLEQKGLVSLEKDKRDARVTRIRLTEQSYKFSETIQAKAAIFTGNLFMGIGEDEMSKARTVLYKMMFNLANMEMGEQEDD